MEFLEKTSPSWSHVIEIALLCAALVILIAVLTKPLTLLCKKFPRFRLLAAPLRVGLIGSAILYLIYLLGTHFSIQFFITYLPPLKKCLFVLVLTLFVTAYLKEFFRKVERKAKNVGISRGKLSALSKIARFVVVTIAALVLFQVFGISAGPILTFGGIGVAAFALASQDILSNFFGGIMIFVKRPFYEGDDIVIPSRPNFLGGISGSVEEVGLYATTLKDAKNRCAYFPNSLFCQSVIINESRQSKATTHGEIFLTAAMIGELPTLIAKLREQLDSEVDFSIRDLTLDQEEIIVHFFISIQKAEADFFVKEKAKLCALLQEIVAPFSGKIAIKK